MHTKKPGRVRKTSQPDPPQRTTTKPVKQKVLQSMSEAKLEPQTVDEASRCRDLQRGRS
jgi:hypothetical protein